MTLHASKGLEFDTVFIVGCEDGFLPLKKEGFDTDFEEERRLFYVGMTRVKRALFLTYTKRRMMFGKRLEQRPSPYLSDITDELKKYEKAKRRILKKKESSLKQFNLFE